jgi:hypothetical protein
MSECTTRTFTSQELQLLLQRVGDDINSAIQHYVPSILPLSAATLQGFNTLQLRKALVAAPTTVATCPGGKTTIQMAEMTLQLHADALTISVLGGAKTFTTAFTLELVGTSLQCQTDCHSVIRLTAVKLGQLSILEPAPGSSAYKALSYLPNPLVSLQALIDKYVMGRELVLPVRIPVLCNTL